MLKYKYTLYLVFAFGYLSAQTQFGFKIGGNFAQLSEMEMSESVEMKWKEGIYVSCFWDKDLGQYFNIQPEFAWIEKGYIIEGFDAALQIEGSSSTSVSYMQFGSQLKYKIIDQNIQWTLNGGGALALAIFGTNELRLFPPSGETSATTRIEFGRDKMRRLDFELYLGTGMKIPIGKIALMLDVGYAWGVLDIEERNDTLHPQNRSIRSTIGIAWDLKK